MHSFPQRVLEAIRSGHLMNPGDRVGVAVSGGADSVALLRLLLEVKDELGVVLSVVHFNHHIRGADSDSDEAFVIELAERHDLELHCSGDDVPSYAAAEHLSLEAAARRVRYRYFESLLHAGTLDRIATAHTLDDQAETVLLRILRGAGTRGLAGIFPVVDVNSDTPEGKACGHIVRPLLSFRRTDIEEYLQSLQQPWRDDLSNLDTKHLRNRVRQQLLPLLEREFTPAVRQRLAELAEIARGEEACWDEIVAAKLPSLWNEDKLSIPKLLAEPVALRRRILRVAAQDLGLGLEFEQVEELLRLAEFSSRAEKRIMLGEAWCAIRAGDCLCFEKRSAEPVTEDYEYALPVPGQVRVPEIRSCIEAVIIGRKGAAACPEQLLSLRLAAPMTVRNWRPGDRFFPAHSKSPKKIKELLQESHVPQAQRHSWPVVVSGDQIVWVRGFWCPEHLLAPERDDRVLLIRETADGAERG